MFLLNERRIKQFTLICALSFISGISQASFILNFDSSPASWVGQGQSFNITPDDGYLFTSSTGYANSLHFGVSSLNSPYGPDWNPGSGEEYHYWTLDLAAPFGLPLEVGTYDNAARWPFQDPDQAGLTFSGDHRGNNRNSGHFEILELSFNGLGQIDKFAADFTQYGEQNLDWWINGQLRYNSDIPLAVPEPSTCLLMIIGVLVVSLRSTGWSWANRQAAYKALS